MRHPRSRQKHVVAVIIALGGSTARFAVAKPTPISPADSRRGTVNSQAGGLDTTESMEEARRAYEENVKVENWDDLFDGDIKSSNDKKNPVERFEDQEQGPEEGVNANGVTLPDQSTRKEIEDHCLRSTNQAKPSRPCWFDECPSTAAPISNAWS